MQDQIDNYRNNGTYIHTFTHTNITKIFQTKKVQETDLVTKANKKMIMTN